MSSSACHRAWQVEGLGTLGPHCDDYPSAADRRGQRDQAAAREPVAAGRPQQPGQRRQAAAAAAKAAVQQPRAVAMRSSYDILMAEDEVRAVRAHRCFDPSDCTVHYSTWLRPDCTHYSDTKQLQGHVASLPWRDAQDAASTGSSAGEAAAAPIPLPAAARPTAAPPAAAAAPPPAAVTLPLPADAASLLNLDNIDDAYLWCVADMTGCMLGFVYFGLMSARRQL